MINLLTQTNIWTMPSLFIFIVAFSLIINIFIYSFKRKEYEKTTYFNQTKTPFSKVRNDTGLLGEYMTFKYLSQIPNAKFLFNTYLPKENGETSEVDLIMLHESGIYVIESKNYGGWIWGSENQKMWTQTFSNRHKEHFYNPIMQNDSHIKWLKQVLPEIVNLPIYSVIVFSERCRLRKLKYDNLEHTVIKRDEVYEKMRYLRNKQPNALTQYQIDWIFDKLMQYCNVSDGTKQKHINDIMQNVRIRE